MKPSRNQHLAVCRGPVLIGLIWLLTAPMSLWGQGLGGAMPGGPRPTSREEFQRRLIMDGGPNYGPVGPAPLIREVRIMGHEVAREPEIRSHLKTRKDNYLDPEVLQADVHRLTTHGRFRDVKVYPQPVDDGVVVIFEVFEMPTIRYIKFLGNRGFTDRKLLQQTGLKVGEALNRYGVNEGRRKIEEFYHSKGYSEAEVAVFEGDSPEHRGVVYVISEGILKRHYKTEFVGNTFVSGERLKALVQSKPGWFYFIKGVVDRNQIEQDVERLTTYYRNFGFFSARISRELSFDDSGKWLTMRFIIDEGPRYMVRNVSVQGNEKFTHESLMEQLGLVGGQYFDLGKMNRDVNALRDAYGAEGHIFADIVAEPRFLETPGELDLVYDVQEGDMFRVGKINVQITGEHPHTRRNVILNRLSLFPGDINDLREVRASERRLKHSQLFENNPATGTVPKIVIRPPELKDIETLARPPGSTVRGQSPDNPRR
jgi:outer membrane protein insertion porin family